MKKLVWTNGYLPWHSASVLRAQNFATLRLASVYHAGQTDGRSMARAGHLEIFYVRDMAPSLHPGGGESDLEGHLRDTVIGHSNIVSSLRGVSGFREVSAGRHKQGRPVYE